MSDTVKMTEAARQRLEAEVEKLEGEGRREKAERIGVAREWGDLKENAEYHAAKDDAAMLEAKIARMRDQLRSAEIMEAVEGDTVGMGSKVTYVDSDSGKEMTFTLVPATEAEPGQRAAVDRLARGRGAGRRPRGRRAQAGDAARRARPCAWCPSSSPRRYAAARPLRTGAGLATTRLGLEQRDHAVEALAGGLEARRDLVLDLGQPLHLGADLDEGFLHALQRLLDVADRVRHQLGHRLAALLSGGCGDSTGG